jgi:hypothetical protein
MARLLRYIALGSAIGVLIGVGGAYLVLMYGPDLNQAF